MNVNHNLTTSLGARSIVGSMVSPVVSAAWLRDELQKPVTSLILLDVTWYSIKDGKQDYIEEHIPGAVWFNIMEGVTNTDVFPRNIPDKDQFQASCRSRGVNGDSHVVVYDRFQEQCGFFIGSRAWWLFKLFGHDRISVLDGGMPVWKKSGYPTTTDIPQVQEGNFTAVFTQSLIRLHKDMRENLNDQKFKVCDTRAIEKYKGNSQDPKTGHYPGAVSTTLATVLVDKETGLLKTREQLQQVFASRGVDLSKPVVGMCNSGMSSCSAALSAAHCGTKDISVYLGGFTEWSRNAEDGEIEQSRD